VAVLELRQGAFSYQDCGHARMDGAEKLECVMTLRAGRIVYERDGLAVPDWRDAPEPYWEIPPTPVAIHRNWRS
jgi:dihydroorotase